MAPPGVRNGVVHFDQWNKGNYNISWFFGWSEDWANVSNPI